MQQKFSALETVHVPSKLTLQPKCSLQHFTLLSLAVVSCHCLLFILLQHNGDVKLVNGN